MKKVLMCILLNLLGVGAIVGAVFMAQNEVALFWIVLVCVIGACLLISPYKPILMFGLCLTLVFGGILVAGACWFGMNGMSGFGPIPMSLSLAGSGLICILLPFGIGAIMETVSGDAIYKNSGGSENVSNPEIAQSPKKERTEEDNSPVSKSHSDCDIFDVIDPVKVGGIILSVIMLISWFIYKVSYATVYDFEYDQASIIYHSNINTNYENALCDFDNCEKSAEVRIYTPNLYTNLVEKGMELLMNLPNEANFHSCSESFTYTEKNEHTVYDTNLYLVPQGDGRIRVEVTNDKYIVYTNGETKTVSYIYFEGYYCSEHEDIAHSMRSNEVEEAFITKNIGYYFYQYGLWASVLLTPTLIILCAVLFGLFVAIPRKVRKNNTDKSYLNIQNSDNSESVTPVPSVVDNSWTCTCGKVNATYVSSCSCGQSKRNIK